MCVCVFVWVCMCVCLCLCVFSRVCMWTHNMIYVSCDPVYFVLFFTSELHIFIIIIIIIIIIILLTNPTIATTIKAGTASDSRHSHHPSVSWELRPSPVGMDSEPAMFTPQPCSYSHTLTPHTPHRTSRTFMTSTHY